MIVGSQQRRELFLVGLATTWTQDECFTDRIVMEVQTHFLVAPFAAVKPDVTRQPGVDKKTGCRSRRDFIVKLETRLPVCFSRGS